MDILSSRRGLERPETGHLPLIQLQIKVTCLLTGQSTKWEPVLKSIAGPMTT